MRPRRTEVQVDALGNPPPPGSSFDATGNQQVDQAPSGATTYVWNFENQMTGVLKPDGSRVTMTYNANFRRTDNWS